MELIPTNTIRPKHFATLLSVLVLVAIAAIAPHAFAQQNGIPLGGPYGQPTPVDPNVMYAWGAMIAIVSIMSGIGVYSTVRKH